MDVVVDARGLLCPLPLLRARAALRRAGSEETVVVLATDPEAPIDIGALALEAGRSMAVSESDGVWRLELSSP